MEQIVNLNAKLLPRSQAKISPFDHGFLYGYGLFETMRAYSGHIFRLSAHLERLTRSAAQLGIPLSASELKKACYDTLKANKLSDARIRLTVSIGEGEATPDPPKRPRPTVLIIATNYTPPSTEAYQRGYRAIVASIQQNSQSPLSRLKTANYLNIILARREAKEKGAHEALLLNERNYLCEGSTNNIFLVAEGNLVTPNEESGCLPGITRQVVIELAKELSIRVTEREIKLEELLNADEAFLTSSLIELMPLIEVDGKTIGSGKRGRVSERLMRAYKELVLRETKVS
jgi:branched-chain amino acid aminotransferase group I